MKLIFKYQSIFKYESSKVRIQDYFNNLDFTITSHSYQLYFAEFIAINETLKYCKTIRTNK